MTDGQLAPDSTHELSLEGDDSRLVVKRYVSGAGSAEKEWSALLLLQEYAPGLAPEPISSDLTADPAFVVMGRLPGEPLRGRHLTAACLDAVGAALERLHTCVPRRVLATMSPAGTDPGPGGPKLRRRLAALPRPVDDPVVTAAYDQAVVWFDSAEAVEVTGWEGRAVFGRGDHNLSNFLLDDDRILLVDFEYSGRADRASELAELVEHISARKRNLPDDQTMVPVASDTMVPAASDPVPGQLTRSDGPPPPCRTGRRRRRARKRRPHWSDMRRAQCVQIRQGV